jgi:hypothetical protein
MQIERSLSLQQVAGALVGAGPARNGWGKHPMSVNFIRLSSPAAGRTKRQERQVRKEKRMHLECSVNPILSYCVGGHEGSSSWRPLRSWRFPILGVTFSTEDPGMSESANFFLLDSRDLEDST